MNDGDKPVLCFDAILWSWSVLVVDSRGQQRPLTTGYYTGPAALEACLKEAGERLGGKVFLQLGWERR